jgi:acyl-CoA dehydrogenase
MHGGIGMTDELDIGLFMKRARVLQELFGDAGFHAARVATLGGY